MTEQNKKTQTKEIQSIAHDPTFTNALASLTACEVERDQFKAATIEQEQSPEFRAAASACEFAWGAVTNIADAWTARQVSQALRDARKAD